ncbi:RecB family exonuclease [Longispora albida]|uniref:RecB family exonuclease n=1 Tax=Longispora albida TaxID=203523 RepID=UPI00037BDEB2|nr:PD-(D/E)XK nuclease family protein [Longispora albida]
MTTTDAETRRVALSPSRAADFKTCPLLYRLRAIDRLPELPTPEMARGTLVHAVLERLFDLPAAERTPAQAALMVGPAWERMREEEPEIAGVFEGGEVPEGWLESAAELLEGYFTLEDPARLEPAERESMVEAELPSGLLLRGFIDRLDASPAGDLRVVDYKTGSAPREAFEAKALFQLKFYALMLWRTRGVVPRALRLLYLKDRAVCDYHPDGPEELQRFERNLEALWKAITAATAAREFRPQPSKLCGWCKHQAHCPEFGGSPPPFPEVAPE